MSANRSWLQPFGAAFVGLLDCNDWLMLEEDQRSHCTCRKILIADDCLLIMIGEYDSLGFHAHEET